jgi:uncharacterized membrane protein YoaK (UPF0700 family)
MDLGILWLVIAAFMGGLIAAFLGWHKSGEPFQPLKFLPSVLRALLAALAAAVSYQYVGPITWPILFMAILAGAGVDSLGNRLAGSSTTTGTTTTSPPK